MRWAVELSRAATRNGKRTVRRFAWLPTLVDTDDEVGTRVWLERYWVQQEYVHAGYGYRWITIARYSCDPLWDAEALTEAAHI